MTLLGVVDGTPQCTCGAGDNPTATHRAVCLTVAWTQPHAMVTDSGQVFYPTTPGDAYQFASYHQARPLRPDVFPFHPKKADR